MKPTKFTYWLVFALALTFAATGCKKKPTDITKLPGQKVGSPGGDQTRGLPPGPPITPDPGVGTGAGPGGGGTSTSWDPANMREDRATLAPHIVHFDFDSSVVKASEKSHVQAVAATLGADLAAKLVVEGHCDERGTEEYNRSLGERRALALREELAKLGVDPERVRTLTFGEDKPFAQGHDESAYRQNRRGEFILYHPK